MSRILVTGGRGLIYVWAKNQEVEKKSSYLRQNKKNNRKTTEPENIVVQSTELNSQTTTGLPIHTNRTQFIHQDILVPWKLKKGQQSTKVENSEIPKTFLRYYHVFEENELEQLCGVVENIKVIHSYYDQGNWCVIFEKR